MFLYENFTQPAKILQISTLSYTGACKPTWMWANKKFTTHRIHRLKNTIHRLYTAAPNWPGITNLTWSFNVTGLQLSSKKCIAVPLPWSCWFQKVWSPSWLNRRLSHGYLGTGRVTPLAKTKEDTSKVLVYNSYIYTTLERMRKLRWYKSISTTPICSEL